METLRSRVESELVEKRRCSCSWSGAIDERQQFLCSRLLDQPLQLLIRVQRCSHCLRLSALFCCTRFFFFFFFCCCCCCALQTCSTRISLSFFCSIFSAAQQSVSAFTEKRAELVQTEPTPVYRRVHRVRLLQHSCSTAVSDKFDRERDSCQNISNNYP